jgi:hypothetical protein
MPAKKRFIIVVAAGILCLAGAGALAIGITFRAGWKIASGEPGDVPFYAFAQNPSAHTGYLRNTLTNGSEVYISDYEESALRLADPEPKAVIGRFGMGGAAKMCAIAGQPVTAYVGGEDGGEMPTYVPYRYSGQPPFNFRTASFRELVYNAPRAANSGQRTTDPALLAEVVSVLRDGTPVTLPGFPMSSGGVEFDSLNMTSNELPGMAFCPVVYSGTDGTIYIAESLIFDTVSSPPQFRARWIPASAKLTAWLKGR